MKEQAIEDKFKWVAKSGYSARGIVYLIVGSFALASALGSGGKKTNSKGALLTILEQPAGQIMLGIMILGLLGYAFWRMLQVIRDTDEHGTGFKGLTVRGGLLISAITHTSLAIWAIKILMKIEENSSSSSSDSSGILESFGGQWLFGIIGITIIGTGFAHFYKGGTARFEKYMKIPDEARWWAKPLCQFGLIARGFVWCIVGGFIIHSISLAQSGEIKGMEGALESLHDAPYGSYLLGVVAAGLIAFGIYSLLEAIYRRIDISNNPNSQGNL